MSRRSDFHDLTPCHALADRFPLLSPDDERELCRRAADGDEEARWGLVLGNLRLAVQYALRRKTIGRAPAEDLFQEAVLGLYWAACDVEPDRDLRFNTFARWRVLGTFRQYAPDHLLVRVPHNALDAIVHGCQACNYLDEARRALASIVASDALNEDDSSEPALFDPAPEDNDTDRRDEQQHQAALLDRWLTKLTPRQREAVTLRYGLSGGQEMTFDEVGKRMGVTHQRAAQMVQAALGQMRHRAHRMQCA